ncbi:response regulator [Shewanella algae]|uniref:response regulator n=1 Tax=Shewanella algae TaxID=38313 RepID=UPI0023580D7F|nr:response regulator [Shewanella algae]MDC8855803.1 response regulator [Shewanella algae]
MKNISFIIADDHPVVLAGVKMLISSQALGLVRAEATTSEALLVNLERHICDILITDFSMPGSSSPDGLNMLQNIKKLHPQIKVIVLTQIQNIGILQALRDSSDAIVLKQALLTDLKHAVSAVKSGRKYLSESVRFLLSENGFIQDLGSTKLSPREYEVIRLFCLGHTVSGIAKKLGKSIKTVSTQKQNAMRKLGLTSDSELFAYSRDQGLS